MTISISEQEQLFFNGINGESGEYALPPMTGAELATFIQGEHPPENLNELRFRYRQETARTLGPREGVDPKKLAEAGWGIIFPMQSDPAVQEALGELLNLRRNQAGEHFRIYTGSEGYRAGESKSDWLERHGAGPGPADPDRVPYYLLIAGSPEQIPYQFQTQLDVQYAVGRIHFEAPQEYANYARSVVTAESGDLKLPRRAAFFGTANPDDKATKLSADLLVRPLFDMFKTKKPDWELSSHLVDQATKSQLSGLLGGEQTPALLFSGSHGMEFPLGSSRQLPHQGALLCQDWPGPYSWRSAIPQDFYFAGDDLSADASLLGLIGFFYACYGAGTPREDDFARQAFRQREAIAPFPFLANLPNHMLSHPRGGALAVIGHVERAWGYSYQWKRAGAQTTVFESTLERLFAGHPVGSALEYFNGRYAELSTVLSDELEEIEFGKRADPLELANMWTANNDARGYTIIGDPAVRLPVKAQDEEASGKRAITPVDLGRIGKPAAPSSSVQLEQQVAAMDTVSAGANTTGVNVADIPAQPTTSSVDWDVNYGLSEALEDSRSELSGMSLQLAGYLGRILSRAAVEAVRKASQAREKAASGDSEAEKAVADQDTASSLEFDLDPMADTRRELRAAVKELAGHLTQIMEKLAEADRLEIATYDSAALSTETKPEDATTRLRILTRINLDGDSQVFIPQEAGELSEILWAVHRDSVQQAQTSRVELLQAATDAAARLMEQLK